MLDAGTGTGDLARVLATRFARVDAVDPSPAMVEVGRRRPGGAAPSLHWLVAPAEIAAVDGSCGLVTASQSLAWMEGSVVLPRWREAMTPQACVAIVERTWEDVPWRSALRPLIARYSTNRDDRPYDVLDELGARGLFRVHGRREVPGAEVSMTVERFLDGLHSQNGLARPSLGPTETASFDDEVRAALAPFVRIGHVRVPAGATVTWGVPT